MLRPELKKPLASQVDNYLAHGGQINTAVNSGKVTTGFDADKERARKRLAAKRRAQHLPRPFTQKEKASHREWNKSNIFRIARIDAYTDQKGSRGHAVLGVGLEIKP